MDVTRLALEIEPGSEPLSGEIRAVDGARERFAGYLELISALEAMRREPGPPSGRGNPGEEIGDASQEKRAGES